jgi:hypothetical protein
MNPAKFWTVSLGITICIKSVFDAPDASVLDVKFGILSLFFYILFKP